MHVDDVRLLLLLLALGLFLLVARATGLALGLESCGLGLGPGAGFGLLAGLLFGLAHLLFFGLATLALGLLDLARFLVGLLLGFELGLALLLAFALGALGFLALAARFLQRLQRLFALGVGLLGFGDGAALDVGALLPDLDVDGARRGCTATAGATGAAARHLELADGLAPQRHPLRRVAVVARLGLPVRGAQERQQLLLVVVGHGRIGRLDLDAGFLELGQQSIGRDTEHLCQLRNGDLRHSDSLLSTMQLR